MNRPELNFIALFSFFSLVYLVVTRILFGLVGKLSWNGFVTCIGITVVSGLIVHFLAIKTEGMGLWKLIQHFVDEKKQRILINCHFLSLMAL